MKTYNEIVDELDDLEKKLPVVVDGVIEDCKVYTNVTVANGVDEAKAYADEKFSAGLKREIVQSLPTEDIDTNTIYMVLDSSSQQVGNVYNEYLYTNNSWELIGTTATAVATLYQHNITFHRNAQGIYIHANVNLTTSSSTAFDLSSLSNWFLTNEFDGVNKEYEASGFVYDGTTRLLVTGIYSTIYGFQFRTIDMDNNAATVETYYSIPTSLTFTDTVINIS